MLVCSANKTGWFLYYHVARTQNVFICSQHAQDIYLHLFAYNSVGHLHAHEGSTETNGRKWFEFSQSTTFCKKCTWLDSRSRVICVVTGTAEAVVSLLITGVRGIWSLFIRGCIEKFPDWVDNKIYAYNKEHLLRSNISGHGGKTH